MRLETLKEYMSLHAERWVNFPKYSETAQYSEVTKAYHPRFGEPDFSLPVFRVPRTSVEIFSACPDPKLFHRIVGDTGVLFPVHPDMLEEFSAYPGFEREHHVWRVVPTSSTRTVATLAHEKNFMIKLHFNKRISRFIRRLSRSSILHSVRISRECEKIAASAGCPEAFSYLPESIGVNFKERGAGFLIREMQPRPHSAEKRFLIPFFALYSKDSKNPSDPSLLSQMIARHRIPPLLFLIERIIDPFLQCWAYAFLHFGIFFESHAQNTLLEVDENFFPKRIVQRDFQSIPVDPCIRKKRGFRTLFTKHVIGQEDYPPFLEQSLIWDHFIGDYLMKSFAKYMEAEYSVPQDAFYQEVRRVFRKYISEREEREFFPAGHVVFGEGAHDNVCPLIYLHEPPLSRPAMRKNEFTSFISINRATIPAGLRTV